jgi:hypothetical protein
MPSLSPRADRPLENKILNGAFDLFQRGVSGTVANNTLFFLADRWRVQNTMTSNITVTRDTSVPTVAQSGFQSAYSMLLTNSASPASPTTSFVNIRYVVEGFDYASIHSQACRLQFWVRSSVTGTYSLLLQNNAGTRVYVTTYTVSAANTWEKKTIDLVMDNSGTWLFDNNAGLRVTFTLIAPVANQTSTLNTWQTDAGNVIFGSSTQTPWASTANATFQLAQISLIPGDFSNQGTNVDIPFLRAGRTIQQELAMCSRYYQKSYDLGTNPGTAVGAGQFRIYDNFTGSIARAVFSFPNRMRTTPTITWYSDATGSSGVIRNNTTSADVAITQNSGTGEGSFSGSVTASGAATYTGHYTADSEL